MARFSFFCVKGLLPPSQESVLPLPSVSGATSSGKPSWTTYHTDQDLSLADFSRWGVSRELLMALS